MKNVIKKILVFGDIPAHIIEKLPRKYNFIFTNCYEGINYFQDETWLVPDKVCSRTKSQLKKNNIKFDKVINYNELITMDHL